MFASLNSLHIKLPTMCFLGGRFELRGTKQSVPRNHTQKEFQMKHCLQLAIHPHA